MEILIGVVLIVVYLLVLGYLNTHHLPHDGHSYWRCTTIACRYCSRILWVGFANILWPITWPVVLVYTIPRKIHEKKTRREDELLKYMEEVDHLLEGVDRT